MRNLKIYYRNVHINIFLKLEERSHNSSNEQKDDKEIIKTATLPRACIYEEYWKDTKHVKQLNQREILNPGCQKYSKVSF